MTNATSLPRYRTLKYTYVDGCPYYADSEIEFAGWPDERLGLEPLNDSARRIAAYWKKFHQQAFFPKTPRDARTGKFYLPGWLPALRGSSFPNAVVAQADAHARMPLYRVSSPVGFPVGSTVIPEGTVFAYLWWPEVAMHIKPVNDAAVQVVTQYEKILANGVSTTDAPWDSFSDTLWIREVLPQPQRQPAPVAREPQRPMREASNMNFLLNWKKTEPPADPPLSRVVRDNLARMNR